MVQYARTVLNLCKHHVFLTLPQQALLIICKQTESIDDRQHRKIANKLRLSTSALGRASEALERAGLIVRNAVERDRRLTILSLTPAGNDLITAVLAGAKTLPDLTRTAPGEDGGMGK